MEAEFASGRMKQDAVPRDRAEFARFFTGLELAEPGIVPVTEWRPRVPPELRPPPGRRLLLRRGGPQALTSDRASPLDTRVGGSHTLVRQWR